MWQSCKNLYHLGIAIFANVIYGFPGRKLTVIAVTGTDGKTTTVNLIYHILKSAGKEVSMISTVGATIHGKSSPLGFHVTNPSSFPLQKFLHAAVTQKKLEKKNNFLVLEVTSHGIDQHRIWGIPITLGLITNITNEHLDYHKTYENYAKTKIKLLSSATIRLINKDDKSYSLICQHLRHSAKNSDYTFSLLNQSNFTKKDTKTKILWQNYNTFTQYNILAAISACSLVTDISDKVITDAINTFHHPTGRQEIVYDKLFKIMIDFAHTPNAFENILSSIKKSKHQKIIHVFGSAGQRDAFKRPIMGEISEKYADVIILTAEDPRSEDVNEIIRQIEDGMKKRKGVTVYKQPDRQEAITKAVLMAKKDDIIVITGKAHETSMNLDGISETPWSDYTAVENALKKL